ncbi:hypothetical protein BLAT2472_30400 [Burkholderia latens]
MTQQQHRPRIASRVGHRRRSAQIAVARGVVAAQPRDQRAHQRTVDEVARQHAQRRVISGAGQPAGKEALRAIRPAACRKIHHREREIARDIDPAQRIVEFDAVEHQDPVAPPDDVVEMQVAVTRAHKAMRVPFGEQRRDPGQFGFVPRPQRGFVGHRDVECVAQRQALRNDARAAAVTSARRPARCVQVMAGQRVGERVRIREAVVARRTARRQHRMRIEPPHADHVLARRRVPPTLRVDAQRCVEPAPAPACDERPDAEVQRAGERPVERALGERATAPLRGPHEIGEREAHGLDALVRIAAGQVNDGEMGFDPPDASGGMTVGRGPAQRTIELNGLSACVGAAEREWQMSGGWHAGRWMRAASRVDAACRRCT